MNAFELSAELSKTRQGRAAKEGELAPMDIVVEKVRHRSVLALLLESSMPLAYRLRSIRAKSQFKRLSRLWKKASRYPQISGLCSQNWT